MIVHRPTSLAESLRLLATSARPLTPVAGATDLYVSWHHRPKDDLALLDLSRLSALRYVRLSDDSLELGALATYWDVLSLQEVCRAYPLLAAAARVVGAIQTQTRGTWAGNIANGSPAADGVPVLMAYDATIVLASQRGQSEVSLDRFFTGYKLSVRTPDQLITAIRLPRRKTQFGFFEKVGARSAQAISKIAVATLLDSAGWRIAASSVAPYVCRCRHLENELASGRTFVSAAEIEHVLEQDVSPIDDIRSTARYRRAALSRVLFHALRDRPC